MPISSAEDLRRCEEALRVATDHGKWDQQITGRIRAMVGAELAAVVLATSELQKKARAKLGEGLWWCNERSLSQSTPRAVARLKSQWCAGNEVFDLCCGIGGDAIHIAADPGVQSLVAIDLDPVMTACACENIRLNSIRDDYPVEVRTGDVAKVGLPAEAFVHLDPDRRDESGRKIRPEDYSPDWETVRKLMLSAAGGIVKLAPAAEVDDHSDMLRIWISYAGSVREQSLLSGTAIQRFVDQFGSKLDREDFASLRCAITMSANEDVAVFWGMAHGGPVGSREKPGAYLVDPDASIRAAGLTEAYAEANSLQPIGTAAGFLTGENQVSLDHAICEEVIWSGSCDDRKLRKTLRSMNVFPVRVKTRGVSQNPNVLEKRYRECGQNPVTLWIGRTAKRHYAAMTRPV